MQKMNMLVCTILICVFIYEARCTENWTELAIGSKSYGMGQTASLSDKDLLGSINYPANLSQSKTFTSAIYYSSPFEDTKNMRIGFSVPLKRHGTIGFNYFRYVLNGIIWRNSSGEREGTASYIQNEYVISYGLNFANNILFGLNGKWIQDKYTNVADNNPDQKNISLDFSVGYVTETDITFLKRFGFGFVMKNFLQENTNEGHIPKEYRLIAENRYLKNKSTLQIAINYLWIEDFFEKYQSRIHVGLEYGYEYVYFRTGYNKDRYTFGIGFNIQFLSFDYGYGLSQDSNYYNPDQHNFTLSAYL